MTKNISPRATFGNSRRNFNNKTINWPGPASYNPKKVESLGDKKASNKFISMKGKCYIKIKDDSPGPIYNTCISRDKVLAEFPKFTIGNSARNL